MPRSHHSSSDAVSLVWSPDGKRIAVGSEQGLHIRDATAGKLLAPEPVWSLAWHPDGSRVATGALQGAARVWETTSGRLLTTLDSSDAARVVAWSPDGTRIATAPSLEGVRIWDAASGKLIRALQDPGVEAVDWAPGGNLVASTTGRAIRFWDTETWECSAEVPLTGSHTAPM